MPEVKANVVVFGDPCEDMLWLIRSPLGLITEAKLLKGEWLHDAPPTSEHPAGLFRVSPPKSFMPERLAGGFYLDARDCIPARLARLASPYHVRNECGNVAIEVGFATHDELKEYLDRDK